MEILHNILSVLLFISLIARVNLQECGPPVDCVVSEWNQWSECTQSCGEDGSRTRSRVIFQDAMCGGTCPFDIEETEACNRKCCPVDCTFTQWTEWECECTEVGCEGVGERKKCRRTRKRLTDAVCGGYCDKQTTHVRCEHLCCYQDCILSKWGPWSECNAQCEQKGKKRRTREIVRDTACGGRACKKKEEFAVCTGKCCPVHCELGEWGEWSDCNTTCGQATQTRERYVRLPQCDGNPCTEEPRREEAKTCTNYINVDCEMSSWTPWSSCYLDNGFCGDGTKFRTRSVLTPPTCNGNTCGNLKETGVCKGPCCRKDCRVSEWSEWGFCSSNCGQGVSNRTRSIESWSSCGGALCPPDLIQSRGCLVTEVTNCKFTEWSVWTTCSNSCGDGVLTRSRQLTFPAYCGGICESELMFEEEACESYTARQNCEVSEWSEWSVCVRTCEGGTEYRNRSIISNSVCGGMSCPNLTESRFCQEPCEQTCNEGVCGCHPGYRMNADNVTCSEITCSQPRAEYCPQTHRLSTDCRYPEFNCSPGYTFNQSCSAYCADSDWILKGSPQTISCREDGLWTETLIYCVRHNKPPLGIMIDKTEIEENTPQDTCFTHLSTLTSEEETSELHAYNITTDATGRFYLKENSVCLTRTANYEEKPDRWNVTFRSTDFEGEYVEETFIFEFLDANGPPSDVKLEPDTVPENCPAGTVVGCFIGTDDDPGQNLTFTLVTSLQKTFTTFDENGQTCIKVVPESQPLCSTQGGHYCKLNREWQLEYRVNVKVTDDGTPPMSAFFEVPIYLSNVNDRQTAVEIIPGRLPENVPAGEALVRLESVDEDENQTYTYRIVSDASGLFSIGEDHLTASRSFDYEKEKESLFEIEIESTDDATPTLSIISVLKLRIRNENEAPFQLQVSSLNGVYPFSLNTPRVPENLPGILGTVMVADQDFDDVVQISFDGKETSRSNLLLSPSSCTKMRHQMFCTSTLSMVTAFDYEEERVRNFTIIATDKAGDVAILNVSLEILNMNDPPSNIFANNAEFQELVIPENKQNLRVAELSAIDDDKEDIHEFKLVDSAGGMFLLEGNTLKTSRTDIIDFELQDTYNLVISITDDGKPRQTTYFDVVVGIIDINEQPSSTMFSNKKVTENSPEGTIVGELTTSDPDNVVTDKQHFVYTLSDDSHGRFQINGNTLMVRKSSQLCGVSTCVLDYEEEKSVTVKIISLDDGEPKMQREDIFTLEIEDTNDPPTDIRVDTNMIKENKPPGTRIGTLSARDVEGDKISYTLQDFVDVFEIQDGNELITMVALDYERLKNYRIVVLAEDDGDTPGQSEDTLTIHVVDVNEQPVFLNVSKTLSVREDVDIEDVVVTYAVLDPDSGEDLTFTLIDISDTFAISSPSCTTKSLTGATDCTIHVILTSQIDIIKTETYNVYLSVTDKSGLTAAESIDINIVDVNIKPTDIMLDGIYTDEIHVKENTKATIVAKLSAVDRDIEQKHTFKIVSNTNAIFQIDGNLLTAKADAVVDFETMPTNMTLEIEVTDSGEPPLSFRKLFIVIVEDINEEPSGITLSSNQISENSLTGTIIGNIIVTDPDIDQSHKIVLVNDGNGRFGLEGNLLQLADAGKSCSRDIGFNCKINYEERSTYNLNVEVIDSGYPPIVALFSVNIDVTDVNEKPRNIEISDNKLHIGSPEETLLGVLNVEDQDQKQMHTFELLDTSKYVKVSSTGQVTLKESQDLNEGQIIDLTIKATDNGSPPMFTTETIQIIAVGAHLVTVTLEAEGGSVQLEENSIQVDENNPVESSIAKLKITYSLEDQDVVTKVVNGADSVQTGSKTCTNIDGQTNCEVELLQLRTLDFEDMKWFDVTFETTANNAKSIDTFRMYVGDKNEAPTSLKFGSGLMTVSENSQNQLLGRFSVSDPDLSDSHVFTISGQDNFIVTENGKILTSHDAETDFESNKYLLISVTVTDVGGLSLTQDFNVTVTDENEPPTGLSLSNSKIPEMSPNGTEVGTFIVSDPDIEQSYSFELLTQSDGRFVIDGSKLLVGNGGSQCITKGSTYCLLDFESQSVYDLIVRVTDTGTTNLTASFVIKIQVTDVNDAPRSVSISATKIPEDTEIENVFAVVNAVDDDIGQTITFDIADNDYFDIEERDLILKKALDYETSTQHNVTIFVVDSGDQPSSASVQFVIHAINVNEPPFSMLLFSTAKSIKTFDVDMPFIMENLPPLTYIGQLVVLDGDKWDELQIESINSDVVVRNAVCIPVTKGTRCTADVRSGRVFDFEMEKSLTITFTATDNGGQQLRTEVTLQIIDSNDPPTNIFLNGTETSELVVAENSRNVLLAKLSVDDKEEEQSHTYTLGGESSFMLIAEDELWITSAATLDYETEQVVRFTIRVTDTGTPSHHFLKEITLKITDVNEAPTALYMTKYTIPENAEEGYEIGQLVVKDKDNLNNKQKQEFKFIIPNMESLLRVESNSLLVDTSGFDYETEKVYEEVVVVSDTGTPIMSSTFTLSLEITDVNEAPSKIEFVGKDTVLENAEVGEVVGILSARDPDEGQSLDFVVLGTNLLSIDGNSVVVNGPLDYETLKEIRFTASVSDNGIPPLTLKKNFTLSITDVNEAPTDIVVINNNDMEISEATPTNEPVVQLKIFDEDLVERLQAEVVYGMELFKIAPAGLNCSTVINRTGSICLTSLFLKEPIDYESGPKAIDVSLKVQDKGDLTLQRTFSFSVTDANEPPKDTILETVAEFVPENSPNFMIGRFSTIDDDKDESYTYVVISPWETFYVDWRRLIAKSALDFEEQDSYIVTIRSQDNGPHPQYKLKEFTILVGDTNEAPSSIELIPTEIAKTANVGDAIAKIHVTDPDNIGRSGFQNHSCQVLPVDYFSVDNTTLVLKLQAPLEEDATNIQVTITCTDTGVPALSTAFDFNILVVENVNAPKEIWLFDQSGSTDVNVDENAADVIIGKLSIVNILTKENIQRTVDFSLSEKSQEMFSVTGDTLRLLKTLDFETLPAVVVEIFYEVTDTSGDNFNLAGNFAIKVNDINEPPTNVDIDGKRSIVENAEQGTVIGSLITYDSEKYQNYTYTLLGASYGLSATDADTKMLNAFVIEDGVLKVGEEILFINFEESSIISLLINTQDSGEPSYSVSGIIRLIVEDANDPPTDIMLSNSEIPENSPVDAVIGMFSVADEDGDQQQACEILNLIDVPFKILDLYKLAVAINTIDFESQISCSVKVSCGNSLQDGTKLQFTKTFDINITNVNEAPANLTLSAYSIEENNQKGQVIAEIRAVDLDSTTIVFSIDEKEDSSAFQIEAASSTLIANDIFDYESRIFYNIVIRATDGEGKFTLKEFELEVINMNEAPTRIKLDNRIVSERSEPGSTVGRLTTIDPDRNQDFVYTLDNQYGSFDFSGNTLIVGENGLDFETASSYNVTVISADNGTPAKSVQQDFIIEIQDANDPPKAIIVDRLEVVHENAMMNTVITSFRIDDPDINQRHACIIEKGEEFFSVLMEANAVSKIILAKELNYEETDTLDVLLSCTDGEFAVKKELTIYVSDVNEAPTSVKLSGSSTILADAPQNFVIGMFTTEDEDAGQVHTFTISGQNSDFLTITANNELILLETIAPELLEHLDPSLKFSVIVADSGTPALTYKQEFTLPITDVEIQDESLPEILFSLITLNHTMNKGYVLGRLYLDSITLSPSIQFTLVKNPFDIFSIENNTFLVLATEIESVAGSSLEIRIQVGDVATLETETKKVAVFITCLLSEPSCKENEICIEHDRYNVCECIDDFSRNSDDLCTKIDDCKSVEEVPSLTIHRCMNGGTCIDGIKSYICNCTNGFEGIHCEIENNRSNGCSADPCFNKGVCIPDSEASSYHCLCETGWTGSLCEVSVDDCKDATCLNGGTCLDEHLTYLCTCEDAWKGLRCEYNSNVCNEKHCNKTHVCVGLTNTNRTLCFENEKYVVRLGYANPDTSNIRAFQARLVDFILPTLNFPSNRLKRESNSGKLQIYVTDSVETKGEFVFSFVIIDDNTKALTRDEVLAILSETCRDMNSGDITQEVFCPSIQHAYISNKHDSPERSSTTGLIIGITITVIFLVALTVTIVIIWKKKKSNAIKPQSIGPEEDVASERGYATMPTQSRDCDNIIQEASTGDTPLTVNTNIIQVAPAPDDQAYTSVV